MGTKAVLAASEPIRIRITNVYMEGDYTGVIAVGSQRKATNVILDTGSSTLALDGAFYDPSGDQNAKVTDVAQEVTYGSGAWVGAVVQTDVAVGGKDLAQVNVAVAYRESANMFGKSNGILGLAYRPLNNAYTMPGPTWPPKFTYNAIQEGRVTHLTPYFTQLVQKGLTPNKFAFYTQRSMVSYETANPATDPKNEGYLVLGGGEESTDLYNGGFQSVAVVADEYYNTNLKAIIVGNSEPITVPPPTKGSGNLSNSIVDSGTNSLTLNQELFNTVVERFSRGENREFVHAMRAGYVPMSSLNTKQWPNLTFVLQGESQDVKLTVTPDNYWQVNAPERGRASAPLFGDNNQLHGQSILGLPLMNGYFTIFDRSADRLGTIKFAPRR